MPLVRIRFNPSIGLDWVIRQLASELQGVVATALHVQENPAAHLSRGDVEIWANPGSPLDRTPYDIEIIVEANLVPERLANLDERRAEILEGVRKVLRDFDLNVTGYVWVRLAPGSFGEI